MKTGQQEYDAICNENFRSLLKVFEKIPQEPKSKEQFEKLSTLSKTKTLTHRQLDAVLARCKHSIDGTYGKTKKPEIIQTT